jgi:SAM-dependent methyltransferase
MTEPRTTYDRIGRGYSQYRQADPAIASAISQALGDAESIVNVGAGSGSYEPRGRTLIAVEPSVTMIRQRATDGAPVLQAMAEELPLQDGSFDAALAILTVHHWRDQGGGLRELARLARRRVVILTWDPDAYGFWLVQRYFPDIVEVDRKIAPSLARFRDCLGPMEVTPLPIPHDCRDGFLGAYWRRPEAYLDPAVRSAISTFSKIDNVQQRIDQLQADLSSGTWDREFGQLRARRELDIGYRLLVWERESMTAREAVPPL